MSDSTPFVQHRRTFITTAAALAVAACGGGGEGGYLHTNDGQEGAADLFLSKQWRSSIALQTPSSASIADFPAQPVIFNDDLAMALWTEEGINPTPMLFATNNPQGQWIEPSLFPPSHPVQSSDIQMARTHDGRAIAVWRGLDPVTEKFGLYGSQFSREAGWSQLELLALSPQKEVGNAPNLGRDLLTREFKLAGDEQGNALLVWLEEFRVQVDVTAPLYDNLIAQRPAAGAACVNVVTPDAGFTVCDEWVESTLTSRYFSIASGWSAPIQIAQVRPADIASISGDSLGLGINANGVGMLIWSEIKKRPNEPTVSTVMYARFDLASNAWTTPAPWLEQNSGGGYIEPQIVLSANGTGYFAARLGQKIFAVPFNALGEINATRLINNDPADNLRLVSDLQSRVILAWRSVRFGVSGAPRNVVAVRLDRFFEDADASIELDTVTQLNNTTVIDLQLSMRNGMAVAVFTRRLQDGQLRLEAARYQVGTGWLAAEVVHLGSPKVSPTSVTGVITQNLKLNMSDTGSAVLLWISEDSTVFSGGRRLYANLLT